MTQKPNKKREIDEAPGAIIAADDLLQLLIEQLDAAMADNDTAMAGLIDSHKQIAADLDQWQQLAPDDDNWHRIKSRLDQQLKQMAVRFQQHDSFNQRLQHVLTAMAAAKALIGGKNDNLDPGRWERLAGHINASYTTTAERRIHSHHDGARRLPATGEDIELF